MGCIIILNAVKRLTFFPPQQSRAEQIIRAWIAGTCQTITLITPIKHEVEFHIIIITTDWKVVFFFLKATYNGKKYPRKADLLDWNLLQEVLAGFFSMFSVLWKL